MNKVFCSSFLNDLNAKELCWMFLGSTLLQSMFTDSDNIVGQGIYFLSWAILCSTLILWPLSVRNSIVGESGPTKGRKIATILGLASFFFSLLVVFRPFGWDFQADLDANRPYAITAFFLLWFVLHSQFFFLNRFQSTAETDAVSRLGLGLKFVFLYLFFPIGVFFIKKHVDAYWAKNGNKSI